MAIEATGRIEPAENLKGIGGWLLLLAIGVILNPFSCMILIAFPFGNGSGFTNIAGGICFPLSIVAAYYFLGEKRHGFWVAWVVAFVATLLVTLGLALDGEMGYALRQLLGGISLLAWFPYGLLSKRVRNTFVNPTNVPALAKRELTGFLYSPIAYVIGAGFLLLTAMWFFWNLQEASLRPLFDGMAKLMVLAVPLLTMGLLSKEFDSGTIETLLTSPVTDVDVVLGKFLGVMVFYLALLATTFVFLALMMVYGRPDAGVAATGYLGMILLGAAYLSVGIFASTLTRHQIVAAVVAIGILSFFVLFMGFVVSLGIRPWADMAARLNAMSYFRDFSRGVFDSRGLAYFLSATALFLFLSIKTLESRRWR